MRNLILGAQVAARFGARMPVGYTPDPFGHISQLPQILAGVGLEAVALQRGLGDEPTELWWEAPDGTRLLTIFFRAGYGNLAWAPTTPDAFTQAVAHQIDKLAPHANTSYLLLLNGTDHMLPQPELPALIAQANERLAGRAIVTPHAAGSRRGGAGRARPGPGAPSCGGCARQAHALLPGVYSARMWIKQANFACETALERYAEPLSALAAVLDGRDRRGELRQAWRTLIEPPARLDLRVLGEPGPRRDAHASTGRGRSRTSSRRRLRALAARVWAQLRQPRARRQPAHLRRTAREPAYTVLTNPVTRAQTGRSRLRCRGRGRAGATSCSAAGQPVPLRVVEGRRWSSSSARCRRRAAHALDDIKLGFWGPPDQRRARVAGGRYRADRDDPAGIPHRPDRGLLGTGQDAG